MFICRKSLDFSEIFDQNLFTDLEVFVSFGTEKCHFKCHRNILSAASKFFRDRLTPEGEGDSVRLICLDMKIPVFKAFLEVVYKGFTVVDPAEVEEVYQGLTLLDLVCLPDPNGPPHEISTSKKRKKEEDSVSDDPPRPILEINLNDLSEEKVRKLIRDGSGPKEFFCVICGKQYTARPVAFNHIMLSHRERRDYPCEYCNESFATSGLRSMHTSRLHAAAHAVRKALED